MMTLFEGHPRSSEGDISCTCDESYESRDMPDYTDFGK